MGSIKKEGGVEVRIVGMPWYRREDYPRILVVMEDANRLPATFDSWLEKAEYGFQRLLDQGFIPVKAELKADDFVAWCQARNLKVDASGRGEWANQVAHEHALHRGAQGGN